jgi:hypothetical protein
MAKNFWFEEDPMMEAVTWAVLMLLAAGFIFGFGVGVGISVLFR